MLLKKISAAYFTLALTVVVDAFGPEEVAFFFSLLGLFLSALFFRSSGNGRFSYVWYLYAASFFVSFLIGIYSNPFVSVVKDSWYFVKPVVYFFFGVFLSKVLSPSKVFLLLISVSVLACVVYIAPILFSGDWLSMNADDLRDKHGQGSYLFVIGLIGLGCVEWSRKYRFLQVGLLLFFLLTILLSSSRILLLFVLVYLLLEFFPSTGKSKLVQCGLILLFAFAALPSYDTQTQEGERESFIDKVEFTLSEIRPKLYLSDWDVHQRWRGYETYMAVEEYLSGGVGNYVFGYGVGKSVSIDFAKRSRTGDASLFELEWLHNGYITALLKGGVLGLIALLWVLLALLNLPLNLADRLSRCQMYLCYLMIISTFFLGGIFNKSDVLVPMWLIGYLSARMYQSSMSHQVKC